MVKAMDKQRHGYSMGAANIAEITGHGCNLTDAVLVEAHRRAGALRPLQGTLLADIPLQRGFDLNVLPPVNLVDPAGKPPARGDRVPPAQPQRRQPR